MRCCYWTC